MHVAAPAVEYDPYAMPPDALREPPQSLWAALRQIGPGIILAGSIVGTGELLLTTSLGARYGFAFLWLILFSCVVKVFVQVELGRYAISSGKPTLGALNELPGPRLGAHWLVWWWFFMLLATVSQLGAMVGGVGQALNFAFPRASAVLSGLIEPLWPAAAGWLKARPEHPWAVLTSLAAMLLLLSGGYRRLERLTTALMVVVTGTTVLCVAAVQFTPQFRISLADVREGFSLSLPTAGLAAAFAAFGITGVGASELYAYPYWCLEKGYARYTGPRQDNAEWLRRALGWLRVMKLDSWASMVVFTIATVAFYCMGALVLHRQGLDPRGPAMMQTLAQMYAQLFGPWTHLVFLVFAWAVLFKTLYVASAGHARLTADFLSLGGWVRYTEARQRGRMIRAGCVFYPALALVLYLFVGEPRGMTIAGGFAQGVTLPVIAGATIYLRYRRTDPRLAPSPLADACLWTAFLLLAAFAIYAVWDAANKLLAA